MVERGDGAIVVTGNTSALRGIPGFVGVALTKASQRILVESLARDLGSKGVHVAYVIIDAAIDMPFARRRFGEGKPDDFFAQPADIAAEIYHFAHQPLSTRTFLVQIRPFGEKWYRSSCRGKSTLALLYQGKALRQLYILLSELT